MREVCVLQLGVMAGILREEDDGTCSFRYEPGYDGLPVSLTMPVRAEPYTYPRFPPFFEGLLPEGYQLEALLRKAKLDRHDYLGQLIQVGADLVGSVTVQTR